MIIPIYLLVGVFVFWASTGSHTAHKMLDEFAAKYGMWGFLLIAALMILLWLPVMLFIVVRLIRKGTL